MNSQNLWLMRHELMLVLTLVVLLIVEIFSSSRNKAKVVLPLSIVLMGLSMIVGGAFPEQGAMFGNMYLTDSLRTAVKLILDAGALLVFFQSYSWINKPENQDKISEFYLLIISTLIGMHFMVSAGNFMMMYLGLELASIPLSALAAFDRYKRVSAEAGIKFILSSAMSTGFMLFGLSMIYTTGGSLDYEVLRTSLSFDALSMLGLLFFISGMAFKISLVPFHLWTADVYEGSPVAVTTYFSVVSKGAAVFVLTWVLYNVFGAAAEQWRQVLIVLAVLTMTVGNLFALRQQNMKRFLAFSSIAQAGFILLGMLGEGQLGMSSVVYYLLVYVFTNIAAFSVVAAISDKTGKENMDDYNALYSTNPRLSLVLMLALFSLAGIPPVAGFFGKLFLFNAAASQGYYWLIFVAVVNATISLYYYLRPVRAMFIEKNENPIATIQSDNYIRIGMLLCVAGIFITGFMSMIFEYLMAVS